MSLVGMSRIFTPTQPWLPMSCMCQMLRIVRLLDFCSSDRYEMLLQCILKYPSIISKRVVIYIHDLDFPFCKLPVCRFCLFFPHWVFVFLLMISVDIVYLFWILIHCLLYDAKVFLSERHASFNYVHGPLSYRSFQIWYIQIDHFPLYVSTSVLF